MSAVKITAGDVRLGDRVSRLKRGPYREVTALSPGEFSVWITFAGEPDGRSWRMRPRNNKVLWLEQAERSYKITPNGLERND